MKTKEERPIPCSTSVVPAPQLKVRSHLRGGASLEACEKALEAWKQSYNKWYEIAKYKNV